MWKTHFSLWNSAEIGLATRSILDKIQIGQIVIRSHVRRSKGLTESVCAIRITILHQSSEAVRNFDSLCSVKSNSASTSVYDMPMISGYVLIKSTLELGMCIG